MKRKIFLSTGDVVYLKNFEGITDPVIPAFAEYPLSPVPRGTRFNVKEVVYDKMGNPLVMVEFKGMLSRKALPMERFAYWPRHWDHETGDTVEFLLINGTPNGRPKRVEGRFVQYKPGDFDRVLIEVSKNSETRGVRGFHWNKEVPSTYTPSQSNTYLMGSRAAIKGASSKPEDVVKIPPMGLQKDELVYISTLNVYGYALAESLIDGRILVHLAQPWPGINTLIGSSASAVVERSKEFTVVLDQDNSPGTGNYIVTEKENLVSCNQFNKPFCVYLADYDRGTKEKILHELWNRYVTWASKKPLSLNHGGLNAIKYKPKLGLMRAAIKTGTKAELMQDGYPLWDADKVINWEIGAFKKREEKKAPVDIMIPEEDDDEGIEFLM